MAGLSIARPQFVAWLARFAWPAVGLFVILLVRQSRFLGESMLYDLVSLLSVVLVAGAAGLGRQRRLVAVFSTPVARWLGARSYALYLVHYPIFLAMTPETTGWSTPMLILARLIAALTAAELAHIVVERPVANWRTNHNRRAVAATNDTALAAI